MAKRKPWITGPALETVLALKAMQVGDQIKIGWCEKNEAHGKQDDGPYIGKILAITGFDEHEHYPVNFSLLRRPTMWSACLCQIVAWRRP